MDQPSGDDHVDDQVEDRLCLLLHKASRAMTAAYRSVLDPLDLTYPQYTVLSALWRSDSATVKELGVILGSDYSTMSPLIKRLEAKSLVQRARSVVDEREVVVRLTDEGQQLRGRAAAVQSEIRAATGLPDAQRDRLVDDLRRLVDQLQSHPGVGSTG